MWRNTDVLEFVEWLREYSDGLPASARRTGSYGLDLYSLHASMKAVIQYLERTDPDAARRACDRYACVDHFGPGPQGDGVVAAGEPGKSCRGQVGSPLFEARRRA